MASRYAALSVEDKQKIIDDKESKNTRRATNTVVTTLLDYMKSTSCATVADLSTMTKEQLDRVLYDFYAEVRTKQGELYKKTSFIALKNGINRHLQSVWKGGQIDICTDLEFQKSNCMHVSMCKKLKEAGKSAIIHFPPIEEADLQKTAEYFKRNINESPKCLQQKKIMDIVIHFARRGRENIRKLKIADLAVTTDSDGCLYVYQISDELTKNHQSDTDAKDARMYEKKGV